jgi:hypothetical protein
MDYGSDRLVLNQYCLPRTSPSASRNCRSHIKGKWGTLNLLALLLRPPRVSAPAVLCSKHICRTRILGNFR